MTRLLNLLSLLALGAAILVARPASGQMERQRADPSGPAEEAFWAPTVIGLQSVTQLPARNLNFSIMHVFGPVSSGADDLFGLDGAANIRFGLDLGLTDRISVGIGRTRFDKRYDGRAKAALTRQSRDNTMPLSISVFGSASVNTLKNGYDPADRLHYALSLPIARRVSDRISLQFTPMWTHANTVLIEEIAGQIVEGSNDHLVLGLAGRFVLREQVALTFEYLPVVGERSGGTRNAAAIGLDLETGGHVFQVFVTTSNGLIEQQIVSTNADRFLDGDFRFGFNVNRVFAVGSR